MNNYYVGIFRRCEAFYIRTKLEKYELFPLEGRLLSILREQSCTQEELGVRIDLDKGRIARAISVLEDRGLIHRETNVKDKRQKIVFLTDEGKKMLVIIDEIFHSWDEICYDGFSEEEKNLHQAFLKRIAENAVDYKRRNGVCKHD